MSDSQPQEGQGWRFDDLDPEDHGESVVGGDEDRPARRGKPKVHRPERWIHAPVSAVLRLKRRKTDLLE
jgi:hypothetical protein